MIRARPGGVRCVGRDHDRTGLLRTQGARTTGEGASGDRALRRPGPGPRPGRRPDPVIADARRHLAAAAAAAAAGPGLALTASERGAAHQASGLPNQDAVPARPAGPDAVVAAVADGHGHRRHFRSATGSALAVTVACEAAARAGRAAGRVRGRRPDRIRGSGQARARHHRAMARRRALTTSPPTRSRPGRRRRGPRRQCPDRLRIHPAAGHRGATVARAGPDRRRRHRGHPARRAGRCSGARRPVAGRPADDEPVRGRARRTSSAPRVVDISRTPLLGVLLATDGYGNAQVADPWTDAVSADLAGLISDRPPEWLAAPIARCGRAAARRRTAAPTTPRSRC